MKGAQILQPGLLTSEGAARQAANLRTNLSYEISEHDTGGSINFSTRDAQGDNGLMGQPAQLVTEDYINALVESLDATFNADDWKAFMLETGINCEWRPAGTQPTPITIHQLADRQVHFDATRRFIDAASAPKGSIGSGVLKAGQAIFINPCKDAIQFSAVTRIYDIHASTTGFTTSSILTAVDQACYDVTESLCSGIVKVIEGSESLKTIKAPTLTSKTMAQKADEILDVIAQHIRSTGFSDNLDEVAVVVPKNLMPCFERMAQRDGYGSGAEAVSAVVGGTCMNYDVATLGNTSGKIYLLPKRLVGLSFRSLKDGSGKQFKVVATRNPSKQCWELEIIGAVDVMGQAWTSVGDNGSTSVDATIKHLVCLDINGAQPVPVTSGGSVKFSAKANGSAPAAAIPAASLVAGSTVDYFAVIDGVTPADDGYYQYGFELVGEADGDGGHTAGIGGLSISWAGHVAHITGSVPADQVGKEVTIKASVMDGIGNVKEATALVGTWTA
jgi:hypothetical protein